MCHYNETYPDKRFVLDAWPTVRSMQELNNDFGECGPGSFSMSLTTPCSPTYSILHSFMATLPLSDIKALAITGPGGVPFWSYFTRLRGVTDLSVAFLRPALSLVEAFAAPVLPDNDPEQEPTFLFPGLASLTLTAAKWNKCINTTGEENSTDGGRTLARHLQDALLRRCSQGMPLRKLCVPRGWKGITRSDMEELESSGAADVVEVVEWGDLEDSVYATQIQQFETGVYGEPDML